ncbi:GbsR/MarR family transcriptional regulator [Kaarinaea lacus]
MKLTPIMEKFVVHWGEMGTRWGVNRTVSQIHALLYLSPKPLNAEEISETLGVARSNVSTSIKELQSWGLVKVVHVLGDRRDHFETMEDLWDIFNCVVEERKKREINPTLTLLRQCELEAAEDTQTPPDIKKKISEIKEFLETLTTWHAQMQTIPRSALVKIMKLGNKITRLLNKKE